MWNNRSMAVGDVRHTFLYTWKLEIDETREVSFPFSAGFGCGQAMKIAQGQKLSLQTTCKFTSQIGGKVKVPGAEVSATVGSEVSETLAYELSSSYEWSYTSRACEYCLPRVRFPEARVKIFQRWALHLPLFASRKAVFFPGESREILGNCRHAPEKCSNCGETEASPGAGPVATFAGNGGSAQVDRVQWAGRDSYRVPLPTVLGEILSVPDGEPPPEQLYLVDLNGRTQSVSQPDGRYLLYSVDDIDRAIGQTRLYQGPNSLLFLRKAPETQTEEPPEVEVSGGHAEITDSVTQSGFSLIQVVVQCDAPPYVPLSVRIHGREFEATVLPRPSEAFSGDTSTPTAAPSRDDKRTPPAPRKER